MNEALTLLSDILDYRQGKEKYDFSDLPANQRENAVFDAWLELENRIVMIVKNVKE